MGKKKDGDPMYSSFGKQGVFLDPIHKMKKVLSKIDVKGHGEGEGGKGDVHSDDKKNLKEGGMGDLNKSLPLVSGNAMLKTTSNLFSRVKINIKP